MTNRTLANLLVLFLLFAGNSRFLITRKSGRDSLSVLPFVSLLISVVDVFVFSLDIEIFLILILSFLSSIWNVRSFLRMLSDVIIDSYEIRLKLICTFNAILSVILFAAVIYFRPMDFSRTKFPIKQTNESYSGSLKSGFSKIESPFVLTDFKIMNFEPIAESKNARTIVLFVPPSAVDMEVYTGFFQRLARNGFSVYAGDFFENPVQNHRGFKGFRIFKNFFATKAKLQGAEEKDVSLETEFFSLISICAPTADDSVFLVSDGDAGSEMSAVMAKCLGKIRGCFDLSYIDDYTTKGFGPVENSNPALGIFLGVKPDRSGYMSNHLGTVVTEFIRSQTD